MHVRTSQSILAALVAATALFLAGCNAATTGAAAPPTTITSATTPVPVSITDAPDDQVLAATLTLNSVVLTDAKGATASLLSAPLTFEATHLDSVQEPLFTPVVPQDTYVSVTLTYSNAVVAYLDPASKQLITANATLANTSQTVTFPTPITVANSSTALLVDFLVAKSVAISGSAVTVTPTFNVAPAPVSAQPTNGLNGLECGVRGQITAMGTNQFTLLNGHGISMTVNVNSNTRYEGMNLTAFSGLAVGMFVEVDIQIQADASLLATRVEEHAAPNPSGEMLVGPVIAVAGSPATSFTQVVRQKFGATSSAAVEKDTINIDSNTKFLLPGRLQDLEHGDSAMPTSYTFSAATLFAGQVVAVSTTNLSNNTATANTVALAPQTVGGTVTAAVFPACIPCTGQVTLTIPSDSWLATVTGKTTVVVEVPTSNAFQVLGNGSVTVGSTVRFNGFLFNNNGTLTLLALVQGPGKGNPIEPHD